MDAAEQIGIFTALVQTLKTPISLGTLAEATSKPSGDIVSRPCESGIRCFMQSMTECCMCDQTLPALPDGALPRHLCS